MSKILKPAAGVVATVLVVVAALVVYRETDLLTGSLVLLSGLMIAALLARRVAAREERAGMADWEEETLASAEAAEGLFADWNMSSPTRPVAPTMPAASTCAPPVAPNGTGPARPVPADADVPEPADPSVAVSHRLHDDRSTTSTEELVASLFVTEAPRTPAPAAEAEPEPHHDPDPLGVDEFISPPTPAFAGAGLSATPSADHRSPIDWTGQGGHVDERVRSSDDILRASEATALPTAGEGGSELARLLAKVEARLREYD